MKRCLSVLLCVLLVLSLALPALRFPAAHAATVAELEDEVKKIESEIKKYKVDCIGLVGLQGESIYSSVVMMYDPKTKKWSLA